MEFIRLKNFKSEEFKRVWEIYECSFAEDEKRDLEDEKKIMRKEEHFLCAVKDNQAIVGLIEYWDLGDFVFIEHLAIKKDLRGKGYGTKLMKQFINSLPESKRFVVLEVEKLTSKDAKRRIRFYERLNFKLNKNFLYIQPAYGKGKKAVELYLMTYPEKIKSEDEFFRITEKIHKVVYGLENPILK